jgi:ankyrin repeat protein
MLQHVGRYDVNCVDHKGWTPLHYACVYGHINMVRMLISEFHADKTVYNSYGCTPLFVAALSKKEEVALAMITEFDCDANRRNWMGRTVLHCACISGCTTLALKLIRDCNVDINVQDTRKNTPLLLAAREGKDVALTLITECNCDTDIMNYDGKTALHFAYEKGCFKLVKELVHKTDAAIINLQDKRKDTLLHRAVKEGKEHVAWVLIAEPSCDTTMKNCDGRTALHYACKRGWLSLVQMLTHDRADINIQDKWKDTPLLLAAREGKEDVALTLITEYNCDTNIRNDGGKTALHYACEKECFKLVKELVHKTEAAIINAQDKGKNTLLHRAVKRGKEDVALALITSCDTNIKDSRGRTALHYACDGGLLSLVQKLVHDRITDINAQDIMKNTPLLLAVKERKEEVALTLSAEYNCDVCIKNDHGKTALHYACETGCLNLVKELVHKTDAAIINAKDKEKTHYFTEYLRWERKM